MTEYEFHDACVTMPPMAEAELDALRESMQRKGFDARHPVLLFHGKVLDGRHRYQIARELGIEPKFVEFHGNPWQLVIDEHSARRHWTSNVQKVAVLGPLAERAVAFEQSRIENNANQARSDKARERPRSADGTLASSGATNGGTTGKNRTADVKARVTGTDRGSVQKWETIKRLAQEQGRQGIADAVKSGDMNANAAMTALRGTGTQKLARTTAKSQPAPSAEPHDGPDLAELVDELQAENKRLTETVSASDDKAEALKWHAAYDRSLASQSEAMDAAARSEKREKFAMRQLMRCGKAVGEDDPRNIAAKVEAMARKSAR